MINGCVQLRLILWDSFCVANLCLVLCTTSSILLQFYNHVYADRTKYMVITEIRMQYEATL
jgi:hypothetical protein